MPNETMAEFIEELRKDADAAFPYDVDYMNVVNGIADRVEEVWEREREKADAMREVVIALANVILTPQEEYDGWLSWVRAMQSKARAALAAQEGGQDNVRPR